jgi:hypothetical protein
MKKIIWPGLVAGFLMLIAGLIFNYITNTAFPSIAQEYQSGLMRPWTDPLMMIFFLYPFILSFVLAWAWNESKKLFKGKDCKRGVMFALSIFLISSIPGMFVTYTSFNISFGMVLSWTVSGLIYLLIAGCVFARMNK